MIVILTPNIDPGLNYPVNANTIYPEITIASLGIHISTKHHDRNENPEPATITAISDISQSIAKTPLKLYPGPVD